MLKDCIDIYRSNAVVEVSKAILKHLGNVNTNKMIVILCIGTDRATGDALGPLVGYRLSHYHTLGAMVFGTLEQPVHAANLRDTLQRINREIPDNFIIAIDACLGSYGHIGEITVRNGPLKPGSGLKKDLPETGDIHITGIVNQGGFMDFLVLQNTRLGLVMKMSEVIADGLQYALWKYYRHHKEVLNQYIQ
jgi:putative sporulation protein YyaC